MVLLEIEMPKNCKECTLFDGEDMCYGDGLYAIKDSNDKPTWCPLVELKEEGESE